MACLSGGRRMRAYEHPSLSWTVVSWQVFVNPPVSAAMLCWVWFSESNLLLGGPREGYTYVEGAATHAWENLCPEEYINWGKSRRIPPLDCNTANTPLLMIKLGLSCCLGSASSFEGLGLTWGEPLCIDRIVLPVLKSLLPAPRAQFLTRQSFRKSSSPTTLPLPSSAWGLVMWSSDHILLQEGSVNETGWFRRGWEEKNMQISLSRAGITFNWTMAYYWATQF